jgi:peptidoglycan/LPS O-acetylase OafA/YrhL
LIISSEIKSLTGVRGLAALYVVIFHWYAEIFIPHLKNAPIYFKQLLGHGYLSVDLFFVLSGFVLCLSSYQLFTNFSLKGYQKFLFKRLARIFPLYISITLLFYSLFNYKMNTLLINLTLFQGLSKNFNNSIIPPGWSLTNEWIIYFFFPMLLFLILKIKKWPWLLIFISMVILLFLSCYRGFGFNWSNYSFLKNVDGFHPIISFTRGPASILRALSAYFLGIFAFLMYQKGLNVKAFNYFIIPLFVALCFPKTDILIILMMPFFIIYLTKSNILSRICSSKLVYFLGLISYSLYVNHYLFIKTYAKVARLIGVNNDYFSFFYVMCGSLILSIITYYTIELYGMKLFKKLRKLKNVHSSNSTIY